MSSDDSPLTLLTSSSRSPRGSGGIGQKFCRVQVPKCEKCPLRPFLPEGGPIDPSEGGGGGGATLARLPGPNAFGSRALSCARIMPGPSQTQKTMHSGPNSLSTCRHAPHGAVGTGVGV